MLNWVTKYLIIIVFLSESCVDNKSEELVYTPKHDVKKRDSVIIYDNGISILKCLYLYESDTLMFRLSLPSDNNLNGTYPVLLFFHGAGERGNDNTSQMSYISELIETEEFKSKSCIAIIPQCPLNSIWVDADWTQSKSVFKDNPENSMMLTFNLLDYIIKNYSADTNRMYVMGISMGGFATWDIITRYPGKFAAAVPICGGGDETKAERIGNTPVWAFHGSKDKLVNVSRTRNMVNTLKTLNNYVKYTEYNNVGHNAWTFALKEKDLVEWLFSKSRKNK